MSACLHRSVPSSGGAALVPGQNRDIRIVPGLAQRLADAPDVMRGEETQLAGAGLPAKGRQLVCMPGTHSKWVLVEDGAVAGSAPGRQVSCSRCLPRTRSSCAIRWANIRSRSPLTIRSSAAGAKTHWRKAAMSPRGCFPSARRPAAGPEADDAAACLSGPFDRRRDRLRQPPPWRRRGIGRAGRLGALGSASTRRRSALPGSASAPSTPTRRCVPGSSKPRAKTA